MWDRPGKPPAREEGSRDGWEPYRAVLALKSLGFTVEEMRRMTTADMVVFIDLATEDAPDDGPKVRDATQADIDALLG